MGERIMDKIEIAKAMMMYGGSFARHLGEALAHADANNEQRIRDAFPELMVKYESFVKK